MYNPNKYKYQQINKETIEGQRKYSTPDGEKLPSVTTILSYTTPKEKLQKLKEWRDRVGHKQAQQITTEAASRGTRMHKWLETYILTGQLGEPGSNPYSKQSFSMAKSIIDNGLINCSEFFGTEVSLYYPKVYAGTTDLVGVHNKVEAIMDHKQTNKPKKREYIEDYFLQLVAYALAHNELFGTNIRKGVIFMCSQNNEYQEFILEDNEFDTYIDKWYKRIEEYYTQFL